jgi:hypothetical protein
MSALRPFTILKAAAEPAARTDTRLKLGEGAAHIEHRKSAIKAFAMNSGGLRNLGLTLALSILCVVGATVPSLGGDSCPLGPPGGDPSCQPNFHFNRTPINTCQTNNSISPCAWADVVSEKENFLACRLEKTGPVALCYYSGVPGQPLDTPGCTLSSDGNTAQCDCYKISKGNPKRATYSYILITSILNKEVYKDTVSQCGVNGSDCLNATNIGDHPAAPEARALCAALRDKTLFPGADLISDFNPIFADPACRTSTSSSKNNQTKEDTTSKSCYKGINKDPVMCENLYVGCMTAPCQYYKPEKIDPSTGLPLVSCTCPTYNGPNQVGNPQILGNPPKIKPYSCSPTPYAWSSSYMPPQDRLPTEP